MEMLPDKSKSEVTGVFLNVSDFRYPNLLQEREVLPAGNPTQC